MAEELIVLVDGTGRPIGAADKLTSHSSNTPLHLAFSCYIFNGKNELLVTQRAVSKKVFPGVWTNSVCGHPAPGESLSDAISRRSLYELGMKVSNLKIVLPDYHYITPPFMGVIENEMCPVFVARTSSLPKPNPAEVENFQWMPWQDYVKAIEKDTKEEFSWWSKDQLLQLKNNPLIFEYTKT